MRVGSSGPFSSIPQGTQQPCTRYIKVHLLVGEPIYFLVEPKSRTKDLNTEICTYMKSQGMQDTQLFGLSVLLDGEHVFVEPDYKLSKYAPKSWRSSSTNGLDSNGKPLLEFFFHVQFYVESPLLLQDELSLEHYYTQIRRNVIERGMLHPSASQQALFILAGLALQAELGDTYQTQYYAKPHNYLPQQLVESCGEGRLPQTLASLHRANGGLSKTLAKHQFIREASSVDTSPIPHNSHTYRLRSTKQEPQPGSVILAICTRGVEIYQENSQKPISGKFLWNDIGKLCFDRKKFEIRGVNSASGEKFSHYTSSDEKSKHLLSLCKVTHQYSMAIQPRLAQIRGREENERKQFREWPVEIGKYTARYCGTGEQRISVISSTSSTTTSGIVSDRVHSLDESEDDLELEIMINSPPAPSVESLALAHLCESTQTTPSPHPNFDYKSGTGCTTGQKTSPVAMTPATTDGSQCSSSASTVVVQQMQQSPETISNNTMVIRCESVTSSLELGYSHTAQHSGLSGSVELDYASHSAHGCTASSGVYTLDEASDNHTVLETVASSSGIGLESHGQRSRSGSLVSNTGSFHGDGSDPSDIGRGNPLTAEELSNLIVHRSPAPLRGAYPKRTMTDNCSDYVSIPPPPLPPPRQDSGEKNYILLEQPKHPQNVYYSQSVLPPIMIPQQYHQYIPELVHPLNSLPSPTTDEANARFITTKPQINVLTARSGYVSSNPNFSTPRYDPAARMKLNSNLIPIVESNNYLDVRQSYLQQYHRQPSHLVARQPPPPPPPPRPNLATVYTSQVTRSQIEQFKQQLYSDVDYVMYPLKDPAISKQEYLDSKIAFGYRHIPPPPYPSGNNIMYRSTPNVAVASGYLPIYNKPLTHNKFSSNQNLSDYYAPSILSSSLYSAAASYSSSSTHSLRYDPMQQQIPPVTMPASFHRTLSDDNILNFERPVLDRVRFRRPPPPVPTDPVVSCVPGEVTNAGMPSQVRKPSPRKDLPSEPPLDISSLREKSRNLDLPLISALCNDRSLLKQTNAFVMPKHPEKSRPVSWHVDSSSTSEGTAKKSIFSTLLSKSISNPTSPSSKNSKLKYPVSGLSTNQIVKANRKTISRHKHPDTKLEQVKVSRSQSTGGTTSKGIKH